MDEELNINALVERYEQMQALGKKIYFDADEFALLADYYNELGNSEQADQIIGEGLRMHPASSELMIMKAKTLVYTELYEEALSFLNSIPDEGDIEFSLLKIESLLHIDSFDEAEDLIEEVFNRDLDEEDLYFFMTEIGFIFNDIEEYDRAVELLEESLKFDESNPDVLIDLAYAYEMKSDFEKAISYNNLLLDINPYSFDAWVNIGKLYSIDEQFDKAIDAFDFALTINENDVSVLKMKALSLFLNDNVEEATRIFEECIDLSPDDASLYDTLLEGYETMEHYDKMSEILDKKEKRFGPEGIAIGRALVEMLKGNLSQSRLIYQQIPESEKNSLNYYMLEGELMFFEGKMREAEMAYMKAALLSEENEDIIDRLVNVSVAQEKYHQAAEYLQQLIDIAPDYPNAKTRLAIVRFEIGAKEPFEKVMEHFSDEELRELMAFIAADNKDYTQYSREKLMLRLNEARENRILFKNIKY